MPPSSLSAIMIAATVATAAAQSPSTTSLAPGTTNQEPGTSTQNPAPSTQHSDPSLDRIRQRLKSKATLDVLRTADIPADFRIEILEQAKLDELLSKLDFSSGRPRRAGSTRTSSSCGPSARSTGR